MKGTFTLLICLLGTLGLWAQSTSVSGTIKDDISGEALVGANVVLAGSTQGVSTDANGRYKIEVPSGDITLVASYTGYTDKRASINVSAGQNATLNFDLASGLTIDQEVVVSGSRKREKLTESPATIETIFASEIASYSGNPGELLARQKGIDYFRAGVAGPGINIRGFNSNFNAKNLQMTDGRYSTLIATGLPYGPLNTTIQDDIERIEIVLGPNSTMYGPNAHNGLLNTITKDPRTSAGTTIALNAGNQSTLGARFRHAQVLSDKFAFKAMASYTRAEEFDYVDTVYIDRLGADGNPGVDGIKEAYEEFELDRDLEFLKAEAALYYTPKEDVDIIFNAGHSNSTYLAPTNVGRNQIIDWRVNYYQLRLTSPHWFAQVNYSGSTTDDTYSIDDRTKQYYRGIDAGLSPADAAGEFSYASGARFRDNSRRWSSEVQYNNTFGKLELITGVQYFLDQANSLGSYLLDENEDDFINVNQLGAYAHLTYDFGGGFRAIGAARLDDHEIYGTNFVPKFGLQHIGDMGTWRLTYGQGIAAPTILNMFGNLFTGLILGNAEGFTLLNGDGSTRQVEPQSVERLQTFELGYRGQLKKNKLFLDANAYYNISNDFLSPLAVLGVATQRGNTPIQEVQSGFAIYNGLVASYINFGEFNTYGLDLGLTYYFKPELSATFNYSLFDYSIDEDNLENDFDNNGTVNFLDLLVNAPNHKANLNISYRGDKFFGSLFTRWVEEYDYFSSFQIASRSYPDLTYRGVPIVENARSADAFNYGPLGGFVTFDLSMGYHINDIFTISGTASNLFDTEQREFTAAPPTGRLIAFELKVNLPEISKKK
ncbi:MAG: hypothetical protein Sapg2KO_44080 [Saprospiraceae bacterium]